MSQSTAVELLVDSSGVLWVGTQSGLNRFDGREFRVIHDERLDPFVSALHLVEDGSLWIGTRSGELARIDTQTSEVLSFVRTPVGSPPPRLEDDASPGDPPEQINAVAVSSTGQLWVATGHGLLTGLPNRPLQSVHGLAVTTLTLSDGELWEGHASGEVWRRDSNTVDGSARRIADCGAEVRTLLTSRTDEVWVATRGRGVCQLRREGDIWVSRTDRGPFQWVNHIAGFTTPHHYWVGTDTGVHLVDSALVVLRSIGTEDGLPHNRVHRIIRGREGRWWVGTWNGLALLPGGADAGAITAIGEETGYPGVREVVAIQARDFGGLVIGTMEGGPRDLTPGVPSLAPSRSPDRTSSAIWALSERSYGDGLWVASLGDGVLRVRPEGVDSHQFGGARIQSVLEDTKGRVWASSASGGLYLKRPGERDFRLDDALDEHGQRFGESWALREGDDGTIWLAVLEAGIAAIDPDRQASRFWAHSDRFPFQRVLTLTLGSDGYVWVGTQGEGLVRFDPKTEEVRQYTVAEGMPHDHVVGIAEDGRGYIWASTNDGIARLDPETDEIIVFRRAAGLVGNRYYANSVEVDARGRILFGGPDGISIIDPERVALGGPTTAVQFTGLTIQGRDQPVTRFFDTGQLDLGPDENFFQVQFAAPDFTDLTQNHYRYRLDPLDQDWVDAGDGNIATYTSVPPGRYTLRVAASLALGREARELAVPLRVRPRMVQTVWFKALVALSIGAVLWLAYRYRMQQMLRVERLRFRVAGRLHDDIGANLGAIALKADMVKSEGLSDLQRSYVEDVSRIARASTHALRETVWVVNSKYDTVEGLITRMGDTADTILRGHLEYGITTDGAGFERPLGMELRQSLHLTFKEALHNVVKHAAATRVDVRVTLDGRVLEVEVTDNGCGFDPGADMPGNGLGLMRERAQLARTTLEITSASGQGCHIRIKTRLPHVGT